MPLPTPNVSKILGWPYIAELGALAPCLLISQTSLISLLGVKVSSSSDRTSVRIIISTMNKLAIFK